MNDPVSGPLSREELRRLVDAPFGKATEVIRQYDPLFGRKEGEKFRWRIEAESRCVMVAYVEAASQEEANKLADELSIAAFDYDSEIEGHQILSVEPAK